MSITGEFSHGRERRTAPEGPPGPSGALRASEPAGVLDLGADLEAASAAPGGPLRDRGQVPAHQDLESWPAAAPSAPSSGASETSIRSPGSVPFAAQLPTDRLYGEQGCTAARADGERVGTSTAG
ncbi:hypothetical protein [Kocuria nitroreducens]|uniref:hypothetical protein n=1 Tax=Kocuria nitroreducens TaxID=3058914 RepID=UPI0036DBB0DE